jgi:hypothetical protein
MMSHRVRKRGLQAGLEYDCFASGAGGRPKNEILFKWGLSCGGSINFSGAKTCRSEESVRSRKYPDAVSPDRCPSVSNGLLTKRKSFLRPHVGGCLWPTPTDFLVFIADFLSSCWTRYSATNACRDYRVLPFVLAPGISSVAAANCVGLSRQSGEIIPPLMRRGAAGRNIARAGFPFPRGKNRSRKARVGQFSLRRAGF